jgi:hypothetical protein
MVYTRKISRPRQLGRGSFVPNSPLPNWQSVYYSRLCTSILNVPIGLLRDVIDNKALLFPSAWANYGSIWSDSLKLIPNADRLVALERDYALTRELMLFGVKPTFEELLADMTTLENQMKGLTKPDKA